MENQHDTGEVFRPGGGLLRGPPAYQARTPWGPGRALLATLGIIGLSIGGGLLLVQLFGEVPAAELRRQGAGREALEGLRFFAFWQLAVIVLTLGVATWFRGRPRDVLALHPATGGWRAYGAALGILAILQVALSGVQYLTSSRDLYADLRPFVDLVRGPEWPLAAAVIGIGAPLSEELLFRGFLQSALARTRLGFWGAAAATTGLWTSLHVGYTLIGILEVLIIGFFFSWLLWRTGSLRVPIFCHAFYNSLIVLSLRLVDLPTAG